MSAAISPCITGVSRTGIAGSRPPANAASCRTAAAAAPTRPHETHRE